MSKEKRQQQKHEFALRLKREMKRKNMTQTELARKLGVTRATVNNWCNEIVMPYFDMPIDLADELQVPIDHLLGRKAPVTIQLKK